MSLTKKKASTKTTFPRSVPTTVEVFHLFHKVERVIECRVDGRLYAGGQ